MPLEQLSDDDRRDIITRWDAGAYAIVLRREYGLTPRELKHLCTAGRDGSPLPPPQARKPRVRVARKARTL